ncbi:MAG: M24 family metallopeptidase [Planctomycetota bacterium]
MTSSEEIALKLDRVRAYLRDNALDGIVLTKQENFSWITAGRDNWVSLANDRGVASVFVDRERVLLLCDNIEEPRMREEECADLGWDVRAWSWSDAQDRRAVLRPLFEGKTVVCDAPMMDQDLPVRDVSALRQKLTAAEIDRYRAVGRDCVDVMERVAAELRPGMRELDAAALLARASRERAMAPIVVLVAADDRAYRFRHPIPTPRKIDRHLMLVLCARRAGLIGNLTRVVHWGRPDPELCRRHDAVVRVDAACIAATRPGAAVKDVFAAAVDTYRACGYNDEWKLHHQGGPTGYVAREYRAAPDCKGEVEAGQAFAWNPSIAGTKSEDTIIVADPVNEIVTAPRNWPVVAVDLGGSRFLRSAIMTL